MNHLLVLWLPILLSAVVVFVISSIIHMVIKWHASDYKTLPNEDAVRAAIRAGNPAPGRYVFPFCKEMKDMGSEAMKQKYQEGPVGHVTLLPNGMPNMGKYLGLWFLWSLVIAAAVGCLVARVYGLDATPVRGAAKLAGVVTFIAYGFGTVTESIWMGRPWGESVKNLLDSVLYGLGTWAVFLYFWPH
jgi:hypothetical protein